MVDTNELRELLARATPGRWHWNEEGQLVSTHTKDSEWGGPPEPVKIIETDSGYYPPRRNDAALIAAAINALPALLDELDRLRRLIREADECCLDGEGVSVGYYMSGELRAQWDALLPAGDGEGGGDGRG